MPISPIVAQAILSQRVPDLVGSWEEGRQLRREDQSRKLMGEILGGRMQGKMGKLAGLDPQRAMALSKLLGETDQQQMVARATETAFASELAEKNLGQAQQWVSNLIQRKSMSGLPVDKWQGWLELSNTDPEKAVKNLRVMTGAFDNAGFYGPREKPELTQRQKQLAGAGYARGTPEYTRLVEEGRVRDVREQEADIAKKLREPSPLVQVQMPKQEGRVPEDFRRLTDPKTRKPSYELIAGSNTHIERLNEIAQLDHVRNTSIRRHDETVERIDHVTKNIDSWDTGVIGVVAGMIPGTPQHDVGMALESIKASVAVDALNELRGLNKTGGGLGNVSDRELAQLEKAWGALMQSQSKPELLRNLKRVKKHYSNWLKNLQTGNKKKIRNFSIGLPQEKGAKTPGKAITLQNAEKKLDEHTSGKVDLSMEELLEIRKVIQAQMGG